MHSIQPSPGTVNGQFQKQGEMKMVVCVNVPEVAHILGLALMERSLSLSLSLYLSIYQSIYLSLYLFFQSLSPYLRTSKIPN